MIYNLFLDDVRVPYNAFLYTKDVRYSNLTWTITRSYYSFVKTIIDLGLPQLISFDHDLADEHYDTLGKTDFLSLDEYYQSSDREMTGYDCAKWLCDYCLENDKKMPEFLVHSANTVGSRNIKKYISNFLKHNPELK